MANDDRVETSLNAERLLGLRRFPGMEDIELDDAARLLGRMTERTIPAGQQLSAEGAPLATAWFVIDGALLVRGSGTERRIGAGETFGMLEMLAEIGDGAEVVTASEALVLAITKDDLLALFSEEFEMLIAAIRLLTSYILQMSPAEERTIRAPTPTGPAPLGYVDRLLFLRELSSFAAGGAEMLTQLADAMTEVSVGGVVARAAQPMETLFLVVDGHLRYGDFQISAGSPFGALHAIAESPLAFDLVAAPGTRVLSCPAQTLLDLLEDAVPLALRWLHDTAARVFQLQAIEGA